MKRMLVSCAVALAAALVPVAPAAAEPATGPAAAAAVTCNYEVWWPGGVNIHEKADRDSTVLRRLSAGVVLWGQPCTNIVAGAYGSCGADNLWKAVTHANATSGLVRGFVATKCLERV